MKHLNENGFAVVEALLVVVILAIVGGTGYFVWHARQNANASLSNAANSHQGIVKASKVTDFASCKAATGSKLLETYPEQCLTKEGKKFTDTLVSSQKYLVVKEWGMKLPLASGIADAYYNYTTNDPASYDSVIYLSTQSLAALDNSCSADGTAVATIFRQTIALHDANVAQDDPTFHSVGTIKVGSYYYGYAHAQGACSENSAAIAMQSTDTSLIYSAFQGIQTAQ